MELVPEVLALCHWFSQSVLLLEAQAVWEEGKNITGGENSSIHVNIKTYCNSLLAFSNREKFIKTAIICVSNCIFTMYNLRAFPERFHLWKYSSHISKVKYFKPKEANSTFPATAIVKWRVAVTISQLHHLQSNPTPHFSQFKPLALAEHCHERAVKNVCTRPVLLVQCKCRHLHWRCSSRPSPR